MTEDIVPYGSSRLIAAVLGCGAIGKRHAHNFNRLGYAVRTWDLDPARCTVPTLKEALDGATLAVIATPPVEHVPLALAAIEADVPWIMVEKPLAPSLRDAFPLQAVRSTSTVIVGYCLRFALATQMLREALPRIVPLRLVEAVYSERPERRPAWLDDPTQGGVLLEYSHLLDLLCWLFGAPTDVRPLSLGVPERGVTAALAWPWGLGTLRMDFWSPTETRIKVVGDGGVIEWRRDRISGPGCDETVVENPAAWLLHEAQELHAVIRGAIRSPGRLCTLGEALDVLALVGRLR